MVLIAALYESVQDAELRARGTIPLKIKINQRSVNKYTILKNKDVQILYYDNRTFIDLNL